MLQVQLLGGVTAIRTGEPVDLGPPKCRVLFAALALSAGEAVPVDRLVDLVWPEDPPRTAAKIVQGYVARLRKGLGADAIERVGQAYRLTLDEMAVDVARFRRRASAGEVGAALAEWGGPPLAGLEAPGLAAVGDGLVEQWLAVVEADLATRVTTEPAASVGRLTELTAAHPFREELWALLMLALYRSERQADALAAYQRARDVLVDELGVEPGLRLRQLETRILEHDPGLEDDRVSAPTVPSPPVGTVTFGAVQVAEATRLWADHGRKMALAVERFDTVVREVAARHGGTISTMAGESLTTAFHSADDGAEWALELQLTAEQEPWPGGIDLRLQIGLHTGEAAHAVGGHAGVAVHMAGQLAAAAHGGQTLVSRATAALLDRSDLRDLGPHTLPGSATAHVVLQLGSGAHPALRVAARATGLPRRLARLVGREDEVAGLLAALAASPLVTVVGPGGIGKTTLAVEAGHRWGQDAQHRVVLVELAEVTDPDDVPRAVADALGVRDTAGRDVREAVLVAMRGPSTLLVVDNCEHLVEAAATLVRRVVEQAPQARVLVTSREPLGIVGEHVVALGPLAATGAAAELFVQRARATAAEIDLDVDRPLVEEICRRLDGIPLAIELAAARTRTLTLGQLCDRLDDHLRLLTGGDRTAAARHQTLEAAVGWSHDLLTAGQQQLFRRLSVFVGPFDLDAAETVAADADGDTLEVDRLLGDLVERSMVVVETGVLGRRFRLLETLRQFALAQLASHGERADLEARHDAWMQDRMVEVGGLLSGPDEVEGVARLGEHWPDLRASVERACAASDHGLAASLVGPVATELNLRRRAEIGDWAERILAIVPPEDDDTVVTWLAWALHRHMQAGDRDAHARLVEQYGHAEHPLIALTHAYLHEDGEALHAAGVRSAAWLRERGADLAADLAELTGVGSGLMTTGRFAELDDHIGALAGRFAQRGPPTLHYFALGMLGYSAQLQGRPADAGEYFHAAADVDVPAGTHVVTRPAEARALFEDGQVGRAVRLLAQHVAGLLETDDVDVTRLAAVEFVTMAARLARLGDAAHVLRYLDSTGEFGELARTALVPDAVALIETAGIDVPDVPVDARQALAVMRDVLEDLACTVATGAET